VIADEAKLSDALATAACVLGSEGTLRGLPGVREVRVHKPQETQPEESKTSP
jgi:membrane-bound lytic murein transglycosylase B